MTLAAAARGFVRAPMRRRLLALEALAELCRARAVTLLPTRLFTRSLGRLGAPPGTPAPHSAEAGQERISQPVREAVASVAGHLPFRALCLQQAIAVSRMLARRGLCATVCLGVNRDPGDRRAPDLQRVAHAWVEVGGRAVGGAAGLEAYVVIARFG